MVLWCMRLVVIAILKYPQEQNYMKAVQLELRLCIFGCDNYREISSG